MICSSWSDDQHLLVVQFRFKDKNVILFPRFHNFDTVYTWLRVDSFQYASYNQDETRRLGIRERFCHPQNCHLIAARSHIYVFRHMGRLFCFHNSLWAPSSGGFHLHSGRPPGDSLIDLSSTEFCLVSTRAFVFQYTPYVFTFYSINFKVLQAWYPG